MSYNDYGNYDKLNTMTYFSNFNKKPVKGNIKKDYYKIGMDINYDGKL